MPGLSLLSAAASARWSGAALLSAGIPALLRAVLPPASTRRYWEAQSAALTRRVNVAAWLERAAPAFFFVATGFAILLVALRRLELATGGAWAGLAAALGLAAVGCGWRARRDFFGAAEARVWLESHLRLDSRLTAAALGLVAWPPEPRVRPALLRWRLGGPSAWGLAAIGVVATAAWVPLPRESSRAPGAGTPPALRQTQDLLTALAESHTPDPRALQQLDERAQTLARRPADEQYSHSVLEAADALHGEVVAATAALARGLEAAAEGLRATGESPDLIGPAGALGAALAGLRDAPLPANGDLLATLAAAGGDPKSLSPEQRAQLARRLADAANGLRGIAGAAGAEVAVARAGADGVVAGSGGEGDGGESAPLTLADAASDVGRGNAEGLPSADLKRLAPGDLLGTQSGAHRVDPGRATAAGPAGAIVAPANGGEAVWVNRLTPAERAAVTRFFK